MFNSTLRYMGLMHLILLLMSMAAGAVVSSSTPQPTLPLIREGRPAREQEIILTVSKQIVFSVKLLVCHCNKWTDASAASVTPVSHTGRCKEKLKGSWKSWSHFSWVRKVSHESSFLGPGVKCGQHIYKTFPFSQFVA